MSTEIRSLLREHWPAVLRIYAEGIATGQATFESEAPDWQAFDAGKRADLRIVAVDDGLVLGWAAASPVSIRAVYSGVVEHSVYVADSARGRGVGTLLLSALLGRAAEAGVWTVQSSIFAENVASLRLHERCGFRVVGRRERIGLMSFGPLAGTWRDTILIEHRSES
ncbi:GNAT family N-acetyltransferase [Subtercola lobariae]|uniref:Phosphinothricin N-acetyltransferase n=1 Tax=Subtercola lobariae TaxID=1588641 RepID=A0A917BFH7_9MICO|nr:GNAT family N-acetyltransferase [Subtercola lobariae]GGF40326.1 phosphinothricin N-acetyltransferase [Subtercola lobariae]